MMQKNQKIVLVSHHVQVLIVAWCNISINMQNSTSVTMYRYWLLYVVISVLTCNIQPVLKGGVICDPRDNSCTMLLNIYMPFGWPMPNISVFDIRFHQKIFFKFPLFGPFMTPATLFAQSWISLYQGHTSYQLSMHSGHWFVRGICFQIPDNVHHLRPRTGLVGPVSV